MKTKLTPLSPTDSTINTQECADSIQLLSGANSEEINKISRHKVATIEVQVTRTDDKWLSSKQRVGKNHQGTLYSKLQHMTL